jgi:hypothetical protein
MPTTHGRDDTWAHPFAHHAPPHPAPPPPPPPQNNKRHPRDQFNLTTPPQRLRVEVKTPDGAPVVPGIASKEALLRKLAPLLPALPGRRHRLEQMARQREMILAQQRAAAAAAAPSKAAAGSPSKSAKKEDKKAAKKKK